MDARSPSEIQASGRRSRARIGGLRHLAPLALVALVACGKAADPGRVDLDAADALWAGEAGFCARTAAGLACWTSAPGIAVARGPTIVTGLDRVTQLAIGESEACALNAGDIVCFVPGSAESRGRSFDQPTALAAIDRATLCVAHASGVSCWSRGGALRPRAGTVVTPVTGDGADGRFRCSLRGRSVHCEPRS